MHPSRSQQRLIAHYKKNLGIFLLVSGVSGLAIGLWVTLQTHLFSPLTVMGALLFLLGLHCLNRPYFLLEPHQLTVYNFLGLVAKRYTFESWDVVKADSRRIYIDDNGITKKVPVAPWLVKTDDWLAMRKLL